MRCGELNMHPPLLLCCLTADGPVYEGSCWGCIVSQFGRVPSEEGGAWQPCTAKSGGSTLRCTEADRGISGNKVPWPLLMERVLYAVGRSQ